MGREKAEKKLATASMKLYLSICGCRWGKEDARHGTHEALLKASVDAGRMTPEEFHRDMDIAYQQYLNGETVSIDEMKKESAEWVS